MGTKTLQTRAGFGAAEEELFTRMCRVVGVAEGGVVAWCRWCRPGVAWSKKGSSGRPGPANCGSLYSSFNFLSNELYLGSIRQEMAEIGGGSEDFQPMSAGETMAAAGVGRGAVGGGGARTQKGVVLWL